MFVVAAMCSLSGDPFPRPALSAVGPLLLHSHVRRASAKEDRRHLLCEWLSLSRAPDSDIYQRAGGSGFPLRGGRDSADTLQDIFEEEDAAHGDLLEGVTGKEKSELQSLIDKMRQTELQRAALAFRYSGGILRHCCKAC